MIRETVSAAMIVALLAFAGCAKEETPKEISLKKRGDIAAKQHDTGNEGGEQ